MFFWNSPAFFNDPADVGNLIFGSSIFSKSSLNIWKLMAHVLLKADLENFEHYFASMWDECSCAVVWTFFGIAFLWDWKENWPFPVPWPLLSFPDLVAYWVQHFNIYYILILSNNIKPYYLLLTNYDIKMNNQNNKIITIVKDVYQFSQSIARQKLKDNYNFKP